MKKLAFSLALVALAGCCSYSQLRKDTGDILVNGVKPVATYEVVNVSYRLLGLIPFETGTTWKDGPYSPDCGSMTFFDDQCSLDDNLASVRHACKTVGATKIRNVTGRVDEAAAWSLFILKKRIVKTSCVLTK